MRNFGSFDRLLQLLDDLNTASNNFFIVIATNLRKTKLKPNQPKIITSDNPMAPGSLFRNSLIEFNIIGLILQ